MDSLMLSSVSLRASRSSEKMLKKAVIKFNCSLCGRSRLLGKTTGVLLRVQYKGGEWLLCADCCDVLADMARFGVRLIDDAERWELSTCVLRMSRREEDMLCYRCGQMQKEHVFVVFDDLKKVPGAKGKSGGYVRLCASCFIEAVAFLDASGVMREYTFKRCEPFVVNSYVLGW